jgi:hypothetical protein
VKGVFKVLQRQGRVQSVGMQGAFSKRRGAWYVQCHDERAQSRAGGHSAGGMGWEAGAWE